MIYDRWTVYGHMQRAFVDYDDIASVTAELDCAGPFNGTVFNSGVPERLISSP